MLIQDLKKELQKFTIENKIDNYIQAINVILTAYPERGTLDKIYNEIIPEYKDKIKNIDVWGYHEVCLWTFIDCSR